MSHQVQTKEIISVIVNEYFSVSPQFQFPVLEINALMIRVGNCAFLVTNATKNFALATRISQLVAHNFPFGD